MRLADKSVQKSWLISMFGWQIGRLCSTIVAWLANKSAKLIVHVRRGWPINPPRDYQTLKDKNLCLSSLGLVHMSGKWISWFSALKIVYIHLPCTVDGGGTSILHPGNMNTKEKSPCQTVNIEKITPFQVKVRTKLFPCLLMSIKKLCSQRIKTNTTIWTDDQVY